MSLSTINIHFFLLQKNVYAFFIVKNRRKEFLGLGLKGEWQIIFDKSITKYRLEAYATCIIYIL